MNESNISPIVTVTPERVRAVCDCRCSSYKAGYCILQECLNVTGRSVFQTVHRGYSGCVPWYEKYIREYVDEAFIEKMSSFLSSGSIDDN